MRRAAKTDDNHLDIKHRFKKYGASVADTAGAGEGFPDLVIGFKGANFLVEVKDGSKAMSEQKLTKPQVRFHREWSGQVIIINSVEQVDLIMQEWVKLPRGMLPFVQLTV